MENTERQFRHGKSFRRAESPAVQENAPDFCGSDVFLRYGKNVFIQNDKAGFFSRGQAAVKVVVKGAAGRPERIGFQRFFRGQRLGRIRMIAADMDTFDRIRNGARGITAGSDNAGCTAIVMPSSAAF